MVRAGRSARCPQCQSIVRVPSEVVPAEVTAPSEDDIYAVREPVAPKIERAPVLPTRAAPPATSIAPAQAITMSRPVLIQRVHWFRRFAYVLFLLTLIPLGIATFSPHEKTEEKLDRTVQAHPEIAPQLTQMFDQDGSLKGSKADLFAVMPNDRFDGGCCLMTQRSTG